MNDGRPTHAIQRATQESALEPEPESEPEPEPEPEPEQEPKPVTAETPRGAPPSESARRGTSSPSARRKANYLALPTTKNLQVALTPLPSLTWTSYLPSALTG